MRLAGLEIIDTHISPISGEITIEGLSSGEVTTSWTPYTMVISSPTPIDKGAIVVLDNALWKRRGSEMLIRYSYAHVSGAAYPGNDVYEFSIPDIGVTVDSGVVPFANIDQRVGVVGTSFLYVDSTTWTGVVLAWSISGVAIVSEQTGFLEGTNNGLDFPDVNYSFECILPIVEWQ